MRGWRRYLKTHDFPLSWSKTEYVEWKFYNRRNVSNLDQRVGENIIPQVMWFKHILGSVIQYDGEIEGDVNNWIQLKWKKWRTTLWILCDTKVSLKLKEKFYQTAVRYAILYEIKCLTVKNQSENIINVAKVRILCCLFNG